jgi:hypothetical protein
MLSDEQRWMQPLHARIQAPQFLRGFFVFVDAMRMYATG